jgi:chromosome segregation ATPase
MAQDTSWRVPVVLARHWRTSIAADRRREGLGDRGPFRHAASIQYYFVTELWKERVSEGARLSLPKTAGIVQLMSDVVSLPTWLTYQQVAERLGLRSASAAAARARRAKWPRRIKNDTLEAEVCVPADLLAAGPQKPRERRQPIARPADATTLVEAVAVAVAPLQAVIETLSRELSAARVTNDALRDQLAAAQSEAAELRGKSAANEAGLEREVFDRRALQQQVDHNRRERQAAQERVVQVQANIRDEQARLQATEDLVTRLKRELNEVRRTNDRRRWWQWR